MKTVIKSIIVAVATVALLAPMASAQQQKRGNGRPRGGENDEWFQKMKSEKVAFFTSEIGLTEAEAKAFWPIYDAAEQSQRESARKTMESYKALMDAVRADKSDSEVKALLDQYVQATQQPRNVDPKVIAEYEKILPAKKVAKIFIAEEKFRQQQIRQLHSQGGAQGGPQGERPQGGPQGGPRGGFGGGEDW